MYMIKSNGGSGSVSNVVLENFVGHGNAYSLDIDQAWASMSTIDGDGVQLRFVCNFAWDISSPGHTDREIATSKSQTGQGPKKMALLVDQ
jgi:hypothetical protein